MRTRNGNKDARVRGCEGIPPHDRTPVRMGVLAYLLFLTILSTAQSAGKLRFSIDPPTGYQFVLDHKVRMAQQEVELSAGPHHFSFWAPQRMVTRS